MRFAVVLSHIQYYRHFDQVIRYLASNGHHIKIAMEKKDKPNLTDRIVTKTLSEVDGCEFEALIRRHGLFGGRSYWGRLLSLTREWINYSIYFHPAHPSKRLASRWEKYFSQAQWSFLQQQGVLRLLLSRPVQSALRAVEHVAPPARNIVRWLKDNRIDLVVASPLVLAGSKEIEYIKAAKSIGVPCVFALASWDNLTTKGTIHVQPDLVFVWNKPIAEEAVVLHGVPLENIVITGAPTFDYWFEMKPSVSREEFCQQAGMEKGKRYIVYLCSSRSMIEDEIGFIRELASEMKTGRRTKDIVLLVRPHPYNQLDLEQLRGENVCVFPKQGDFPDVPEAKQVYFDTLYHAEAAVGVNTTAMLESAIADIPCVTIVDERYRRAQTDMGHFRHLVNGNFLQMTNTYKEAVDALNGILDGADEKRDERHRFVMEFIRPHGMDRPVSELFARALELAAERKSAAEIMRILGQPSS